MTDRSESPASRGGASSNGGSRDSSNTTDMTSISRSNTEDVQTVTDSTVDGQPPSNPETHVWTIDETDASTTGGSNSVTERQTDDEPTGWGLRVIQSREEPWSPGTPRAITPRASSANLQAHDENEPKDADVNHDGTKDDDRDGS